MYCFLRASTTRYRIVIVVGGGGVRSGVNEEVEGVGGIEMGGLSPRFNIAGRSRLVTPFW